MSSMPSAFTKLRAQIPSVPHRRIALAKSFSRMRSTHLRGDYFEFGLYRGASFSVAHRLAGRYRLGPQMRFFGFDSFQGLPEPAGVDVAGEFRKGDYACSRAGVTATLNRRGADWSRIHLVEGWYDRSLTEELKRSLAPAKVGVALVDCDLYESTVPVLRFLTSLLQEGSILLFDDWDCFGGSEQKGERRAFREFLEENPRFAAERWIRFGRRGQAFVVHERSDAGTSEPGAPTERLDALTADPER
ncbi:MAG: TylF/MycF/NovP-related O-methyltransferase [Actinomycetota bacterium]